VFVFVFGIGMGMGGVCGIGSWIGKDRDGVILGAVLHLYRGVSDT
jgi:hypothetical protein